MFNVISHKMEYKNRAATQDIQPVDEGLRASNGDPTPKRKVKSSKKVKTKQQTSKQKNQRLRQKIKKIGATVVKIGMTVLFRGAASNLFGAVISFI